MDVLLGNMDILLGEMEVLLEDMEVLLEDMDVLLGILGVLWCKIKVLSGLFETLVEKRDRRSHVDELRFQEDDREFQGFDVE